MPARNTISPERAELLAEIIARSPRSEGRPASVSSRMSSRLGRHSTVRDDAQSLDEHLRKQRVIRYMEEERERAERSKLLREEHDAWLNFRRNERADRLKYMTKKEIEELLRREAEEEQREREAAATAARAKDAVRRSRDREASVAAPPAKKVDARVQSEPRLAVGKSSQTAANAVPERCAEDPAAAARAKKALEEELQKLRQELKDAQVARDELKEKLQKESARNDQSCQNKDESRDLVAQLRSRVAQLTGEVAILEKHRNALEADNDRLLAENRVKTEALGDMRSEMEEARQSAARNREGAEQLHKAEEALEAERAARREADKQNVKLREQLAQATYQVENASKSSRRDEDSEIRKLRQALAKLEKELEHEKGQRARAEEGLRQAKEAAAAATDGREREQKRAKQLQRDLERARQDGASTADSRAGAQTEIINGLKSELRNTEKELQQEIDARRDLESKLKRRPEAAPKEELTRVTNDLKDAKERLAQEKKDAEHSRRRSADEVASLKRDLAAARAAQESEAKKRRDAEEERKSMAPAAAADAPDIDQYQHLRDEISTLQAQLAKSLEREQKAIAEADNAKQAVKSRSHDGEGRDDRSLSSRHSAHPPPPQTNRPPASPSAGRNAREPPPPPEKAKGCC